MQLPSPVHQPFNPPSPLAYIFQAKGSPRQEFSSPGRCVKYPASAASSGADEPQPLPAKVLAGTDNAHRLTSHPRCAVRLVDKLNGPFHTNWITHQNADSDALSRSVLIVARNVEIEKLKCLGANDEAALTFDGWLDHGFSLSKSSGNLIGQVGR
jgi:hypothetical protein